MAGKISDLDAAVSVADVDQVELLKGGSNYRATIDQILDGLTGARVAAAVGSTAANLVYAGPVSGGAAVPAARALVAADIPSLAALYQGLDPTLTALAALDSSTGFVQQTGADTFTKAALTAGQINTALTYTAANAASLNSSALTGNLPALDGSALTALNATNIGSGTLDSARLPTVPTTKGGTGLTAIGTALQVLRVNAGATALEFADASGGGISGLTEGTIPVAGAGGTSLIDSPIFVCTSQRIGFGGTTDFEPGMRWSGYEEVDFVRAGAGAFIGVNALYFKIANASKLVQISDGLVQFTDSSSVLGSVRMATLQIGNSAAATVAVGTLANKIEVFDATGASLGFVPVYATIT